MLQNLPKVKFNRIFVRTQNKKVFAIEFCHITMLNSNRILPYYHAKYLSGFREPLFKCVRSDPHTVILVATELCSRLYLPTILKESCNDFPCPAR